VPVSSGLIRRVNDAADGAAWASTSDAQRPTRDIGIRCDFLATPGFGQLLRSAKSVPLNDWTIVCQFVTREGLGGPTMGLVATSTTNLGLHAGSLLGCYVNGSPQDFAALTIPRAQKCSVVVRGTPTQILASMLTGGVTTSDAIVAVIVGGTTGTNGWYLAPFFGNDKGLYGSVNQALVVDRAVSNTEATRLLAWCDSLPTTDGYPLTAPLVGVCGDSIATSAVAVSPQDGWPFLMLQTLRASSSPTVEECNVAIAGSGVSPAMYAALTPFYSASRAKNVVFLASGTNDLANGNGAAATTTAYFAACDALRAQGWRVIACTVLPRSDVMVVSQVVFNAQRVILNANIVAGGSHYDALANVALVSGMGADGDSNNATNYSADKVHPIAAGHALIEPTYRAAAVSLL
jgi:lysophospholipase L1-like esterase